MTETSGCFAGIGISREDVVLSGMADVLSWRHTLEVVDYDQHRDDKRP
jgi:hypothetical protein